MSIGFLCNGKPLDDYSHSEVVDTSCFLNGRPVSDGWRPSKKFGTCHGIRCIDAAAYGDDRYYYLGYRHNSESETDDDDSDWPAPEYPFDNTRHDMYDFVYQEGHPETDELEEPW